MTPRTKVKSFHESEAQHAHCRGCRGIASDGISRREAFGVMNTPVPVLVGKLAGKEKNGPLSLHWPLFCTHLYLVLVRHEK